VILEHSVICNFENCSSSATVYGCQWNYSLNLSISKIPFCYLCYCPDSGSMAKSPIQIQWTQPTGFEFGGSVWRVWMINAAGSRQVADWLRDNESRRPFLPRATRDKTKQHLFANKRRMGKIARAQSVCVCVCVSSAGVNVHKQNIRGCVSVCVSARHKF
jgi:hypothetical protein